MSADTAMTRKGFGEMAITATMAGPIFNILIGQGLSTIITFIKNSKIKGAYIDYSITNEDGSIKKLAVLPLVMIIGELGILGLLLFNAIKNKFNLSFYISILQTCLYLTFIIGLSIYCVSSDIEVESD